MHTTGLSNPRTGVPGQYKRYDPLGELYYEAVRYLQGLPPTPTMSVWRPHSLLTDFQRLPV